MASLSICHLGLWLEWKILLNLAKFSDTGDTVEGSDELYAVDNILDLVI